LARYRPEYPFPSCVPAELESVFPGTDESTTFQRLLPNHWTQKRMPAKIHRSVPRSKDRNRTSPLPLKSKQNPLIKLYRSVRIKPSYDSRRPPNAPRPELFLEVTVLAGFVPCQMKSVAINALQCTSDGVIYPEPLDARLPSPNSNFDSNQSLITEL